MDLFTILESNDSAKGQQADEIIEISDQENDVIAKKSVPGTEAVSEDELPTETAKVLFTNSELAASHSLQIFISE